MYIFSVFLIVDKTKPMFYLLLVVSEVPELYRKLQETCRKNFPEVSSNSALVTASYLPKTAFKGSTLKL